ncbi:MAG: TIGR02996 domain-containing protein [Myxococcaceae bacterium]|nr:TIGR02996 domain-containing protein [Myxococcaceae bacterium]
MTEPVTLLKQAAKATSAGDALEKLLLVWQGNPSPELEAAILALDDRPTPFEGDTAAFRAAVKKASAMDRGPLLAAATKGTLADVRDRLSALTAWPRDPRTTRMLVELLSSVPWSSDSSKPAWTAAFELMVRQNDARFVALSKSLPAKWKVRASMQGWLERAFAGAVQRLSPASGATSADEKKALDAVVKAFAAKPARPGVGTRDVDALLAAIYAAPADDAPRLVLADVLQERNDPRGEFITLQVAGNPKARKLLEPNLKKWLGPLAPVLAADVGFRRGFPAEGRTKFRHQADVETFGALPAWATFERLEWGTPTPIPKGQENAVRFIGPAFRHLKHADGPSLELLLAAKQPWALESLVVEVDRSSQLEALGAKLPTLFPGLKQLVCVGPEASWFQKVKHLGRLEALGLTCRPDSADWDALNALDVPALWLRVARSAGDSVWRFSRGAAGRFSSVVVTLDGKEQPARHVERAEALPGGMLETFEVVATRRAPAGAEALVKKALQAAVTRRAAGGGTTPKAATSALRELRRALLAGTVKGGDALVVDVDGAQLVKRGSSEVVGKLDSKEMSCAGLDADGTLLAVVTWKQVMLYSLPDLVERWSVPTPFFEARALCFVDGALWHLARTGSERLDLKTGKQLEKVGPGARLLEVSRDGRWWLGYGKSPGTLSVGPAGGKKRSEFAATTATFLPDGRVLAAGGSRTDALTLSLVDAATGAVTAQAAGKVVGFPEHLTASPGGRFATLRGDGAIVVIDTSPLTITHVEKTASAQLANVTPDGKTLLLASSSFESKAL